MRRLFGVKEIGPSLFLESFHILRPAGLDLRGGRAGLDHLPHPADAGEQIEMTVRPEKGSTHIQIPVSVDDLVEIDPFAPDLFQRFSPEVDAVADFVEMRRVLRPRDAPGGETE